MSNYPPGTTQGMITALCPTDDSTPNTEECFLCHRVIQQDDNTRRWFLEEDMVMGSHYCLTFCDSLEAFPTQQGWVCSVECLDEYTVEAKGALPRAGLFLVKARTA